jgi:hypothetical protein
MEFAVSCISCQKLIIFMATQSELDTLAATLKQLENQKGEAQKRLNDLKGQVTRFHTVWHLACIA